jgi:hypothetical protein
MSNQVNDTLIDSYLDDEGISGETVTEQAEFIADMLREDGEYTPATHGQTA